MANEIEPNYSFSTATTLSSGEVTTGTIWWRNDDDYYAVTASAPSVLYIDLEPPVSGSLNLSVFDSNGHAIKSELLYDSVNWQVLAPTAGTYYFEITQSWPQIEYPTDFYSLTVTVDESPDTEIEPNFNQQEATILLSGSTTSGILEGPDGPYYPADEDWFKISIDTPGILTVGLDPLNDGTDAPIAIEVRDTDFKWALFSQTDHDSTWQIGAHEAGDYYVRLGAVQTERYQPGQQYSLTLTATAGGNEQFEKEDNSYQDWANPLALGATIKGNLDSYGDLDTYEIEITNPGLYYITINDSDLPHGGLSLRDSSGRFLIDSQTWNATFDNSGTNVASINIAAAGTYYVSYAGNNVGSEATGAPYSLTVSPAIPQSPPSGSGNQPPQDGAVDHPEPNDSRSTATVVELDDPHTGVLSSGFDLDYYVVTLNAEGMLTATFTPPPYSTAPYDGTTPGMPNHGYVLSIFDETGSLLVDKTTSSSAISLFSAPVHVPGNYYLEVASWNPGHYESVYNPEEYSLSLSNTVGSADNYEAEPNNDFVAATPLTSNIPMVGFGLSDQTDVDVDLYSISASSPGVLSVHLDWGDTAAGGWISPGNMISVDVYGPDALDLGAWEINMGLPLGFTLALPSAGEYFVSIQGAYGQYSLTAETQMGGEEAYEVESNDLMATATPIESGVAKIGKHSAYTDKDYFVIEATEPGKLHLDLSVATDYSYGYFVAQVFDASGQLLGTQKISPSNSMDVAILNAGNVYVLIQTMTGRTYGADSLTSKAHFDAPQYSVAATLQYGGVQGLEAEPNDQPQSATPLTMEEPTYGQLSWDTDADVDVYSITPEATGTLLLTFDPPPPETYYPIRTVEIHDANGTLLNWREPWGISSLSTYVESGNTYYVSVTSDESYYNEPYQITASLKTELIPDRLESEANDQRETANLLVSGATTYGSLSSTGDADFFAITADTDGVLTVNFDAPLGFIATRLFTLSIYDSSNTLLAAQQGQDMALSTGAESGATYYAVVTAPTDSYGFYNQGLYGISAALENSSPDIAYESESNDGLATADTLNIDIPLKGQISTLTDKDYFLFFAAEAGAYEVEFDGAPTGYLTGYLSMNPAPQIDVLDSDGVNLASWKNVGSEDWFVELSAPGDYYLVIDNQSGGYYQASAQYTLAIAPYQPAFQAETESNGSSSTATPLNVGTTLTASIDSGADTDWVSIYLEHGQTYLFGATPAATQASQPSLTLSLYTDTEWLLGRNNGALAYFEDLIVKPEAQIAFTAPADGNYFLRIDGQGSTGSYTLESRLVPKDELLNAIDAGFRWDSSAEPGSALTLTYSFPTVEPGHFRDGYPGFQPFTEQQKGAVREILESISEVANITFREVTAQGEIRFSWEPFGDPSTAGVTFVEWSIDTQTRQGDIFLNTEVFDSQASIAQGDETYLTLVHEIGHALDLKHPGVYGFDSGDYLPFAEYGFDNNSFTVMSYVPKLDAVIYNPDLAVLDVAALQQIYGANTDTRNGDDSYVFLPTIEYLTTLWDGGGIDTIDASSQILSSTISLEAGTLSSIGTTSLGGAAHDNVAIAFGAQIENASGGSGDDLIIGNDFDNELSGAAGNDFVDGASGTDVARYSGNRSGYVILLDDGGDYTINDIDPQDGDDGNDILNNIEQLSFADLTISLSGSINNYPRFTSTPAASIAENIAAGSIVYTVAANDPDIGQTLSYSFGGPDADAFEFDVVSGQVRLKASPDYEAKASYRFSVGVSDDFADPLSASQDVTLSVRDLATSRYTVLGNGSSHLDLFIYGSLSLAGQEVTLKGNAGVDSIYVGTAANLVVDFTQSGLGADQLYLEGAWADYAKTYSGSIVTLTGSNDEIVKAISGDSLVFSDGTVAVADALSFLKGTTAEPVPGGETSEGFPQALPDGLSNSIRAVVQDAAGETLALARPGENLMVKGGGGNDIVYVMPGSTVDATQLGLGHDKLYLAGNLADYTGSVSGNAITLTRSVEGYSETVKVLGGSDSAYDSIVFSDGMARSIDVFSYLGGGTAPALDAVETTPLTSIAPRLIAGTADDDILTGTDWADLIDGGPGQDTLTGLSGNDIFVLGSGNGASIVSGADVVTDFELGSDHIGLAGLSLNDLFVFQGNGTDTAATNTIISTRSGEFLAVLLDVSANAIAQNNFITAPA